MTGNEESRIVNMQAAIRKLVELDPVGIDDLERIIEDRLRAKIEAVKYAYLSPEDHRMAQLTGTSLDDLAIFKARESADAQLIASLPAERVAILRQLNPGLDDSGIAAVERETRAFLKARTADDEALAALSAAQREQLEQTYGHDRAAAADAARLVILGGRPF